MFQFKEYYILTIGVRIFIIILLFLVREHTQDKKSMMHFTFFNTETLSVGQKCVFLFIFYK